ncbi:insulin-like growth factor-binding protein complex acid labile subunit [Branchiostoma floridae]|uniref:Insulin-like growth factor-binding protein complex acid labile subunit n=1 Tax=Branchiostoma floridae TaxID=7739 RepID=A0A9J7NCF6_BRAFL|nr:insulin-like growth factor-binding protein complex acid labile subunit [Branchiostoma floridae]
MGKTVPGVLMLFLVILKTAEAARDCHCSATYCHCSGRSLTNVPQDLPATITTLALSWNHITAISQSDFSRYSRLTSLSLDGNPISTINNQAFYHLSNLGTLDLSLNLIRNLRVDMFRGLGNLQDLTLFNNDISDIEAGTFRQTPRLTILYLYQNKLTNLSSDMFAGLGNLQDLRLYNNEISDIEVGTFNLTSQLTTLYLYQNKLTNLSSDMFTGLEKLQDLRLNNNDISDIQAGTFSQTPRLRTLYLYHNKLTSFRSDLFTRLGNLEDLRLYNNYISDIEAGTFSSTSQLTTLHLYQNKLTKLRSDMFAGLGNLEDLRLYNNEISDIQVGTFNPTPQLRTLYLRNNRLKIIRSGVFAGLGNLWHLTEADNGLYTCTAASLVGSTSATLSVNLTFEEPTIGKFKRSTNNTLTPGETLHLLCESSGFPTPDIIVILPSGVNATVESDGRVTVDINANIIIRDITAEDAGLYVCIAASSIGSTNAILIVKVTYEEPTIVRFERNNNVFDQEKPPHLFCKASGIPTPDITVILPSGQNVTAETGGRVTEGENGTVTIRNVTAKDEGLYVCTAVSPVGSTFSIFSVVDLQQTSTVSTAPTFSLPALIGAIFGSVAGTVLIGGIILTIWCKRNNRSPPNGPDFSVVFNNTNTTTTVITNSKTGHLQTMSDSSNDRNSQHVSRPASSQFEPYEDVLPRSSDPRPRAAVLRQTATRQALRPPKRNNGEPPPVPPPRTASAGCDNGTVPEDNHESSHHYQPLRKPENSSSSAGDSQHHYQSLQRPQQPH